MAAKLSTTDVCQRLNGLGAAVQGRLHREAKRLRTDGEPLDAQAAAELLTRLSITIGGDLERLRQDLRRGVARPPIPPAQTSNRSH